jgi:hypothetical protein
LASPATGPFCAASAAPRPTPSTHCFPSAIHCSIFTPATALWTAGLLPQIGLLHALKPGHLALASDLVEEFRHDDRSPRCPAHQPSRNPRRALPARRRGRCRSLPPHRRWPPHLHPRRRRRPPGPATLNDPDAAPPPPSRPFAAWSAKPSVSGLPRRTLQRRTMHLRGVNALYRRLRRLRREGSPAHEPHPPPLRRACSGVGL